MSRFAAGADHEGSDLAGELHGDRTDTARGAVDQDAPARREVSVVEQPLPGGPPGDRPSGGHGVFDISRVGSEVAGLHRGVLGQGAVAGPADQSEHPLADGRAGGSVPYLNDDTRQLVAGHARRPVAPGAVGPRSRPVQLAAGEPRGLDPHDVIVLGGVGVGHVRPGESTNADIAVSYGDGFHDRLVLWGGLSKGADRRGRS